MPSYSPTPCPSDPSELSVPNLWLIPPSACSTETPKLPDTAGGRLHNCTAWTYCIFTLSSLHLGLSATWLSFYFYPDKFPLTKVTAYASPLLVQFSLLYPNKISAGDWFIQISSPDSITLYINIHHANLSCFPLQTSLPDPAQLSISPSSWVSFFSSTSVPKSPCVLKVTFCSWSLLSWKSCLCSSFTVCFFRGFQSLL